MRQIEEGSDLLKLSFKIWLWLLEFRFNRVPDDKKIAFLVKKLLNELKSQGREIYQNDGCGMNVIWVHRNGETVNIENIVGNWAVQCGSLNDDNA